MINRLVIVGGSVDLVLQIFCFRDFGKDSDKFEVTQNNLDHASSSSNFWKACKSRSIAVLGKLVWHISFMAAWFSSCFHQSSLWLTFPNPSKERGLGLNLNTVEHKKNMNIHS